MADLDFLCDGSVQFYCTIHVQITALVSNHRGHSALSAVAVSSGLSLEYKQQINYIGTCLNLLK